MSFWSAERLLQMRQTGLIAPFCQDRVKCGAYELSLGEEASLTSERKKFKLQPRGQLSIPPGQFGLLLTQEVVSIPNNAIGFISIRFRYKCRGLINVSGFHVDPGFKGHLKFAVYNAGSHHITLSRGDAVFLIWFSDLSEATKYVYKGDHADQKEITSEDQDRIQGKLASPAELKKQIDRIKRDLRILVALFIGILLTLLGVFAKSIMDSRSVASSPPAQSISSKATDQNQNQNVASASESKLNSGGSVNSSSENKAAPRR